jgi:hypothetical protein
MMTSVIAVDDIECGAKRIFGAVDSAGLSY